MPTDFGLYKIGYSSTQTRNTVNNQRKKAPPQKPIVYYALKGKKYKLSLVIRQKYTHHKVLLCLMQHFKLSPVVQTICIGINIFRRDDPYSGVCKCLITQLFPNRSKCYYHKKTSKSILRGTMPTDTRMNR